MHGGLQALKPRALSAVSSLRAKFGTKKVMVVGHSLGGSMASNAGPDLQLNDGFSASVMTFGATCSRDSEYHSAMERELSFHWRVTHNDDLVVHVPPKSFGFYHTATEIHFSNRGELKRRVCDGSGEDEDCANDCTWIIGGTCTSVDDRLNYLGMPCCSSACSASTLLGPNATEEILV